MCLIVQMASHVFMLFIFNYILLNGFKMALQSAWFQGVVLQ